jgi:hypothetical protein
MGLLAATETSISAGLSWTGVETSFPAGFNADAAGSVKVYYLSAAGALSLLTQGVHYGVALGAGNAVTVNPLALPAAPGTLFILRDTPALQQTDFNNLSSFSPDVHTMLHTRAIMLAAERKRDFARTLSFPIGENGAALPRAAARAGLLLGFALDGSLSLQAPGTNTIRSGAGVPDNALGINGDFYINETAQDFYKREAGAYVLKFNIKGDDGDPGPQGPAAIAERVVRLRTTANVNLSGGGLANGTTHDGFAVVTGELVFVAAQSAPAENGVYVVPAAGAAARHTDYNSWGEIVSAGIIGVQEGTVHADTLWQFTSNAGGTLGTTAITFKQINNIATNSVPGIVKVTASGSSSASDEALLAAHAAARYAAMAVANIFTANQTFQGTTKLQQALEKVAIWAAAPGSTQNYDVLSAAVQFFTSNNANNWTLNVRGDGSSSLNSLMAIGDAISFALIVTNGSTAYRETALTIDSAAITPTWLGSVAPSAGTPSKLDVYTFTIIKTASATFTALASFAGGN